ncbi:hypothetical protein ACWEWI_21585 [Streptomyces sp. NPDC003753]
MRRFAADSAAGLTVAAEALLANPATEREECGTSESDGPATLVDSAEPPGRAGAESSVEHPGGGRPAQAPVPLPAGC